MNSIDGTPELLRQLVLRLFLARRIHRNSSRSAELAELRERITKGKPGPKDA